MYKHVLYCCDNSNIFQGSYESILSIDRYVDFRHEVDTYDFDGYYNEIGRYIAEQLTYELSLDGSNIVKEVIFNNITSPREYNFTTDKLWLDVEVDLKKLKYWICADKNSDDYRLFSDYLATYYTDRSGFISFVANKVEDYFLKSYERYPDILLDFFFLRKVVVDRNTCSLHPDDWTYEWWNDNLIDKCEEIALDHFCPRREPFTFDELDYVEKAELAEHYLTQLYNAGELEEVAKLKEVPEDKFKCLRSISFDILREHYMYEQFVNEDFECND